MRPALQARTEEFTAGVPMFATDRPTEASADGSTFAARFPPLSEALNHSIDFVSGLGKPDFRPYLISLAWPVAEKVAARQIYSPLSQGSGLKAGSQ